MDSCLHAEFIAWPAAAEIGSVGLPKAACPSSDEFHLARIGQVGEGGALLIMLVATVTLATNNQTHSQRKGSPDFGSCAN